MIQWEGASCVSILHRIQFHYSKEWRTTRTWPWPQQNLLWLTSPIVLCMTKETICKLPNSHSGWKEFLNVVWPFAAWLATLFRPSSYQGEKWSAFRRNFCQRLVVDQNKYIFWKLIKCYASNPFILILMHWYYFYFAARINGLMRSVPFGPLQT